MYRFLFFSLFVVATLFGTAQVVGAWFDSAGEDGSTHVVTTGAGPEKSMETSGDETTIRRDGSGRFFLTAQANGRDARFLIDTGADIVALTLEEAEDLGVKFDKTSFEAITQTASGVGMGQHVTIDQLMIADHEFRNVDAVVIEGLQTNLLGQSMIRQLGNVEMREDTMVIRHGA
ncbi:MAG: TIGR02281 family clan AA aspartic protease [Novosphingobium sp.]